MESMVMEIKNVEIPTIYVEFNPEIQFATGY
jgi:hypothetical protein